MRLLTGGKLVLKTFRKLMMLGALLAGCVVAAPALAQGAADPNAGMSEANRNVFFFAGPFHEDSFYFSPALPLIHYDGTFMLGAGYQYYFYRSDWSFQLGTEIGLAARIDFGGPSSAELWGGLVFRHDGVVLFDKFRLSPSLTVGYSLVTGPIGSEAERADRIGVDVPFLIYLGPELAVTPLDNPEFEAFFRVQHRSGGFGIIMDHMNGSNAVTLGVRYKF